MAKPLRKAKHAPADASSKPTHVWELLPDETPLAFSYFATYRDLGPDRSLPKTAAVFSKSVSHMTSLSNKYRWVDRARAYDHFVDAKIRSSQMAEIAEMRTRHSNMAMDMVLAAHSELKAMVDQVRVADGELAKRRRLEPDATRAPILAPVDIARLAKTGAHLERLTRGEATAVTEIKTEFDTSSLTVEELATLHDLLGKMGAGLDD